MFNKKMALLVAAIMVFAVLLVACQPETVEVVKEVPVEVTRVITETVTEAGQSTEVTRVVTEQVIVTATPEPVAPVSFAAPNPRLTRISFLVIRTRWIRTWLTIRRAARSMVR
ncbi:MAG: hypothetical protein IPJ94_04135 [Chloroflexi bacterium]|nr:hypothetical protein [Chloroflexota bacterium]